VTLAIDMNFAVRSVSDRPRKAVGSFLSNLGQSDRVKLLLFNTREKRSVDFTTDAGAIDRAIRESKPAGQANFLPTLKEALG
jgi:hypothetical protein